MVQVPLIMAFSLGKKLTQFGIISGLGSIFLFKITTATNTTTETMLTILKTNLS
jgi:hypothetical protein